MSVYNNLKSIRKLSNASLTSIIDITNLNFRSLSDANLEFLSNIQYDETLNTFKVYKGTFDFVEITDRLTLAYDSIPTWTIDSLGRAEGQELLVKVAETKRLRLTDFNDWPDIGVPGEVIYTGIQNQRPEFGEDFIGYLQTRGWVSLTDKGDVGYLILRELDGSPPVPPCPETNTGIVWVGPPGYATATVPTTQTLYYTDENCKIFDLTSGGSGGGGAEIEIEQEGNNVVATASTLNFTGPGVLVTSPSSGQANIAVGTKNTVRQDDVITVSPDYQYFVYGNLTIEGVINNYGEVVIANGTLIVTPTGQFNNLGMGLLKILNLATGESMQVVLKTFTTAALTPFLITHGLNTRDFTYNVREGNIPVDVDITHIDDNSILVTTTLGVTNAVMVLQAKL